jgi:hypothetical protein
MVCFWVGAMVDGDTVGRFGYFGGPGVRGRSSSHCKQRKLPGKVRLSNQGEEAVVEERPAWTAGACSPSISWEGDGLAL